MNLHHNTILITGGGSGIGRALAEALLLLGNQVLIADRSQRALDETVTANPAIIPTLLDIQQPAEILTVAASLIARYPTLNVLINNAGILRQTDPAHLLNEADLLATITTNLLGPIRVASAFLPHLQRQPAATIVNVSSNLAFTPLVSAAIYCASKAAVHTYTMSLRYALKDTPVSVREIIPPYVATNLNGGLTDPRAMPVPDFIAEVLQILATDAPEIVVERARALRGGAEPSREYEVFTQYNDRMTADPH